MRTIIDWQNENPEAALRLLDGSACVMPLEIFGATPDHPWAEFLARGCFRRQIAEERLDKRNASGLTNQQPKISETDTFAADISGWDFVQP